MLRFRSSRYKEKLLPAIMLTARAWPCKLRKRAVKMAVEAAPCFRLKLDASYFRTAHSKRCQEDKHSPYFEPYGTLRIVVSGAFVDIDAEIEDEVETAVPAIEIDQYLQRQAAQYRLRSCSSHAAAKVLV